MANLRLFPPDNIEPIILKKEIAEAKEERDDRRIRARLLLMFLLKTNDGRNLSIFRKHNLRPPEPEGEEGGDGEAPEVHVLEPGHAARRWKKVGKEIKAAQMAAEGKVQVVKRRRPAVKKQLEMSGDDGW